MWLPMKTMAPPSLPGVRSAIQYGTQPASARLVRRHPYPMSAVDDAMRAVGHHQSLAPFMAKLGILVPVADLGV